MAAETGMSDVTGYRTDMGGLGQDQKVSQQLHGILTSKLPLLSSPGTVIENSLYYDVGSSSVSAVEMQETFAKDRITMTNTNYNAAASAYIPSQLFTGNVYWVSQFTNPTVTPGARAPDDEAGGAFRFYTPSGWGFNAIQSLIVYMGASSIAQIEIDSMANYLYALGCCETKGKRQAMIAAAGLCMDNYTDSTILRKVEPGVGGAAAYPQPGDSILRRNDRKQDVLFRAMGNIPNMVGAGNIQSYDLNATTIAVPLRLPWCSMAALEKKLPLDSKLLTQPVQVVVQTKPIGQVLQKGSRIDIGTQWQNSSLQIWQEELSDKSLSVRNELLAAPQFNVGYPFQYLQSIPFNFPTTDTGSSNVTYNGNQFNNQAVTLNITSIINSDLTTMLFSVTCGSRFNNNPVIPSGNTGDYSQFCPLFGEKISNMQLLLNGQRFFSFDQGIYDGVTLCKQLDDVTTDLAMPGANASDGAYDSVNGTSLDAPPYEFGREQSHHYELNFSRLRAIVCESHLQNTARFTNQTFQLTFNVERGNNYIARGAGADPFEYPAYQQVVSNGMRLNMAYCYNGVFLIGGDMGTSKLVTN